MVVNEIFASQQIGFPILSTLIGLPLAVAVAIRFVTDTASIKAIALAGALAELALALWLLVNFIPGSADIQFAERRLWIDTIGASYHLGVDGISVLFIPLTALVTLLAMLVGGNTPKFFSKTYLGSVLVFEAVAIGVFSSLDLILFYLFYELALVPIYLLIKLWGTGTQRQYAALKYILYMLVGSASLLVGIVLLGISHPQAVAGAGYSFDLLTLAAAPPPAEIQTVIFVLLLVGFAVKGPLLPFHTWMPSALTQGPVGVGIFLVGLKLGTYAMLRVLLPLAPASSQEWGPVIVCIGLATLLYGALIALVQQNLRRLLAFASISHVGLVLVGLFALNTQSVQGSLLMMLNMALASAGLFFLAGALFARLGSSELSAYGGLARQVPRLAFFFFLFGMASIGLPGTSGFHGEFLTLLGAFNAHWAFAAMGVLGVILSAGYFLWFFERAFFGPVRTPAVAKMKDLSWRETALASVFAAIIIGVGLYPAPLLSVTEASVTAAVRHANAQGEHAKVARVAVNK